MRFASDHLACPEPLPFRFGVAPEERAGIDATGDSVDAQGRRHAARVRRGCAKRGHEQADEPRLDPHVAPSRV